MTKEKCKDCGHVHGRGEHLPTAERVFGCYSLICDLGDLLGRLREHGVTYFPLKGGKYQELIHYSGKLRLPESIG